MTSFLTYVDEESEGFDGEVSANGGVHDTVLSAGNINPGLVLCTAGRAPTSASECDSLIGCLEYKPLWMPASTSYAYDQYDPLPYMRQGEIRLVCEEAMALTDKVYVRHTAKGGNTILGTVRNDTDRAAATPALLTVTDASDPVDDGVYAVDFHLEIDGVAGPQLTATFTGSTTTQANFMLGLKAAFEAQADVTATVATTETLSIAVDGTTDSLACVKIDGIRVPSTNTTVVRTTQGAEAPTCARCSDIRVAKAATAAGNVKCNVLFA